MVNILKAREDLAYQLALLSTELAEIFSNAPSSPQSSSSDPSSTDTGGSRKPIEGDCPVCVMEYVYLCYNYEVYLLTLCPDLKREKI